MSELYTRADTPEPDVSAVPDASERRHVDDFSEPTEPGEASEGSVESQYEDEDSDEPDEPFEPEEEGGPEEPNLRDLPEEPREPEEPGELTEVQEDSADVDDPDVVSEEPVEAPEMFRKDVFGGQELPSHLSPEKKNAIEGLYSEAEEKDIAIISGEEADSYFEWVASREEGGDADPGAYYAVTLGDTILVRDSHKFDTRTIGEEMIHSQQQMDGRGDVFECEVEAREALLADPEKYALTEEEIGELEAEVSALKERGYY
ncbi:hypothetical protein ACF09C_21350 [Streptomyces sp. NPDC014870]|uniref:hypothetical protein n=1 Tax=Streptomyces sp. NPDC014870 TaxID=3364925 RepID=UPI0036F88A72